MLLAKEDNWTNRGSNFAPPETGADLGTGELSGVRSCRNQILVGKVRYLNGKRNS